MYRPHRAGEAPQIVHQGASGATRRIGGGIVRSVGTCCDSRELEEVSLKLDHSNLIRRIRCVKCGRRFDLRYAVEHYSTQWLWEDDS